MYVDDSIGTECRDTETTGSLDRFASVLSARTLVGHDKDGRLMIVQVDGKTDHQGYKINIVMLIPFSKIQQDCSR